MATDKVEERLLEVVRRLIEQTRRGRIAWRITDTDGDYLYASSKASVIVSSSIDHDDDQHVKVQFLNDDGITVGEVTSTFTQNEFGHGWNPGENNPTLEILYEWAKRSALKIDEVLENLFEELGDNDR